MQKRSEAEEYEIYRRYVLNDGFCIPKLRIDMPLYRYRRNTKFTINEIQTGNIYLASLGELNDPFDSSYAQQYDEVLNTKATFGLFYYRCYFLSQLGCTESVTKQIDSRIDEVTTLKDFAEYVAQLIEEAGDHFPASAICKCYNKYCPFIESRKYGRVASFSETWNSIPMWAYYADNHKGVCIKYDFSLLDENNIQHRSILNALCKVWYSDTRPMDKEGSRSPFVKSLQWAHEQEWRLVRNGDAIINLPCITEVYFGFNVDGKAISAYLDAIKKSPFEITPYLLIPKPDEYSFQKVRINMK